jgi:hypothetical protein
VSDWDPIPCGQSAPRSGRTLSVEWTAASASLSLAIYALLGVYPPLSQHHLIPKFQAESDLDERMKYPSDEPVQHMSTSRISFRFIILRSAQYSSDSRNSRHEARICIPPVHPLGLALQPPHERISNTRYTHYSSANQLHQ